MNAHIFRGISKKRILLISAVLIVLLCTPLFGQSFGGSISFFFPESLSYSSGSVSKEAGISTSLGLGETISIPVGFTYIKASGFMPYEENDDGKLSRIDDEIWYTADTFIPYLRVQAHVPLGTLFVEGFAGIAGAWIVVPQMNEGAMGRAFAERAGGSDDFYAFDDPSLDISFGYGYQAGGSIGVQIEAIRVQITGIFTDIRAQTTASSDTVYKIDYEGGTDGTVTEQSGFEETFVSRLRGISVGLGGSYSM